MNVSEEWTAKVMYHLHYYKITSSELAMKCGYTASYISSVLNGKKEFKSEDSKNKTKERILYALDQLERERKCE